MASTTRHQEGPVSTADDPLRLHLALLGGFRVQLGDLLVPLSAFSRRKALSLLKLLALQPDHQVARSRVLELLWPQLESRAANAQLYKVISYIRSALASVDSEVETDQLIALRGETVRLVGPGGIETDVETFEHLASLGLQQRESSFIGQAIANYAGDLLPDDRDEIWTAPRRDELRGRYVELLIEQGRIQHVGGQLTEAEQSMRLALEHDGLRETAHRELMLIHAHQGRRSEALRQFERCVASLRDGLGVDPSDATRNLARNIEQGTLRASDSDRPPAPHFMDLPALAGCRNELSTIQRILQRLATGNGGVLAITGDGGFGKTRLAQEVLLLGWRRQWRTLYGAAHSPEGQISYQPVIEALRSAIWADPAHADLIPAEVSGAIPEISPTTTTHKIPDRLAAQAHLFAAVARYLQALTQTAPVIMVLDDLQDADEGTLRLFHFLARQTANQPLLLVGAWRPKLAGSRSLLREVEQSLLREQLLETIRLEPLSISDHHVLLDQLIDDGHVEAVLASGLYHLTEGVPLFAREIFVQLMRDGRIEQSGRRWRFTSEVDLESPVLPHTIQDLMTQRITSLSTPARHLLQLASVIGDEIPAGVLEAARGVAELDALDELLAARLLVEQGEQLRFTHGLLRSTVYDAMSGVRRRALHRQIGRALESLYLDNTDALPVSALAHHYERAGEADRAIEYLIQAGDRAETVYDHDRAIRCYTEVCSLLVHMQGQELRLTRAWERVGDVQRMIGNVPESHAAYIKALEAAPNSAHSDERNLRFNLHRKAVLASVLAVDLPTAMEHLERAKILLGADPIDQARLLIAEALLNWHAVDLPGAVAAATEALEIAEQHDAQVEAVQAREMLALAHISLGDWQAGMEFELQNGAGGWSPEIVVAIDAHLCLFQFLISSPDWHDSAKQFIDSAASKASDLGDLRCLAICHFALGHVAVLQGQPGIASDRLTTALDLHQRIGSPSGAAYSLAGLVQLLTASKRFDAAWPLVRQGLIVSERASIRDHCLSQMYAVGIENRLEAGDLERAANLVEAAKRQDEISGPCSVCRPDLYTKLAAYHIAIDEPDTARAYIDQAMPIVEMTSNQHGRARLLRERGKVYAVLGDPQHAGGDLLEAASIFRQLEDEYDLARTMELWVSLDVQPVDDPALRQFDAREVLARFTSTRVTL